ncbi:ABC-F family ATP-binding cassette domain-containing protein [Streptomyces fimicarius]|uniref:ABC-F family ATP-binding cassette domain-containing protein n=1 Tax=Streptomyces griseus TaxID=1911 RepID=UPI0036B036A9
MTFDPTTSSTADILAGSPETSHVAAERVSVTLGDRPVLRDISLSVGAGERVGLIGENGLGKSTLLRVLGRDLPPDHGDVVRAVTGRVGFLPQEPAFPEGWQLGDVVDRAFTELDAFAAELRDLEARMAEAEGTVLEDLLARYGRAQDAFEDGGGWQRDARAGEVLDVFGLGSVARERPVGRLSSGQRARLALAELTLATPSALILDEPTNHLDDRATGWLLDWLSHYRGPCVIASHDRALLSASVTSIADLDGPRATLVRHGGDYRDYLTEQRAARTRWEADYTRWQAELDAVRRRIAKSPEAGGHGREMRDRNKMAYDMAGAGAQAAVARAARAARLDLRRLLDEPVPRPPQPLRFSAQDGSTPQDTGEADRSGVPLLSARGIVVKHVLHGIDLELRPRDLVVVVGGNGSGKSTLMKVLAGVQRPDAGSITARAGLRIGYLPQETDYTGAHRPLLEVYAELRALDQESAEEELGRFGLFRRADLSVPVERLSTGQRRRLALAELFAGSPELLLLDEPTNHLSLPLVEQLQEAVNAFSGPVVMITHDRTLRHRYADRLRELADGYLCRPGR